MSRFSVAKDRVLEDLDNIIEELLQANRKHKRRSLWNVRNRFRAKSQPDQMVVWLQGNRRGAWKDFVSGEKGDAIDLVAFGLKGVVDDQSRMDALEWIEDRYGLKSMSDERREQLKAEASARRKAAEANELKRREASIERARKFFFSCSEQILDTPVEAYFKSRNIDISKVPNLGRSLRFRPDCEYWMEESRPKIPALVSAMVDVGGRIGACHYTFLRPDGSGKADIEKAKLMFPETSGLVIRLTNGPSGLSAEDAVKEGVKGICGLVEGVEDGASVGISEPELRMWSAGSLSGLLTVPDHPAVSSWIIFKDNDWGKPQAQALFDRAVARIKSFRKPVEVISMPAEWGKDVNDAIRSGW
ncbi:DUF7146 domain-containing protein [Brucella anthropi]|uniref:DUF7146 domain-containing protein n=1 Tax=Brucella anthropi TaxID=529 RepID=UPI003D9740E3